MKKLTLLLVAMMVFIMSVPANVFAATDEGVDTSYDLSAFKCGEPLISEEVDTTIDDYKENDANMAEKFITGQAQNLLHIGDINSMSSLIFGNPYCVWAKEGGEEQVMSADGIFTLKERENIIDPLLKLFGSVFFLMLTLSMLLTGLKTMGNSVRGQAMDEFWNDAKMWGVAFLLALFYNDLTNWLFQINAAIVLEIQKLVTAAGDNLGQFSAMSSIGDFLPGGIGSFLIIVLGEWVLALILNVVYIARKVIILLLLVIGFVAVYSLMFPKTREFFGNWVKELIGNVFLQSIHAIVFYAMIMFTLEGAGVFFKLGLMMMFLPVSGMISKWLNIGDSSSKIGSGLSMVGLGGVVSTMMLASQAGNILRGGSMTSSSALSNAASSSSNGGSLTNLATSMANDSMSTSIASNASGSSSSLFNMAKGLSTAAGSTIGSAAGLIAGPAGVLAGNKLGGAVGGGLVQMGRNMGVGASSIYSNLKQGSKFEGEGGKGFKALFSGKDANGNPDFKSLNARRQLMGGLGESLGVMVGGQRGADLMRSAGFGLGAVSRQRLASAQSASLGMADAEGNLKPVTFGALAQANPNADMKMMQTNQGSGMYMNTSDGWKQVGLTGSADSSLKDGQVRVMDYKLSDPSMNYQYQSNGTYKAPVGTAESSLSSSGVNSMPVTASSGSLQTTTSGTLSGIISSSGSSQATVETTSTPMGSSSLPPTHTEGHTGGSQRMETVGLQGSTPDVMRTSEAYIVNAGNSNLAMSNETVQQVASSNTVRHQDSGFNAKNVNPDAFVYHNVPGSNTRTSSDRVADRVERVSKVRSVWQSKGKEQVRKKSKWKSG